MIAARGLHFPVHGQRGQARDPEAAAQAPLQDGPRPRRGRFHGRRLRDRRAARARSAVGQPHRQRLRRLRRHQRRLARRGADLQRHHARADDAGGQRPGPAAVPEHQPGLAAAAQLPRVRRQGREVPAPPGGRHALAGAQPGLLLGGRPRDRARRRAAVRPLHRRRGRGVGGRGPQGGRAQRRLPRAGVRAVPGRDRPRHLRADRARRRGLGRRADLLRRARLDRAADGLRAAPDQGPRARRRRHRLHHQPRHRRRGGRSSSSSSTRSCPT